MSLSVRDLSKSYPTRGGEMPVLRGVTLTLSAWESAETAYLRARGLSVAWRDAEGLRYGFPRVSVSCDYARPARFEDVLTVEVHLEKVGRTSVAYRFEFLRDGVAIATGRAKSVYCREGPGHTMQSVELPADVRAKLESDGPTP